MNPEERAKYQRYLINLAREKDILDTARAEGEKKGKIIGMEKGESLKSFTTLMNLLMELPDVPNASKSIITGIPLEKIVQLEKILQLPDFTGILADVLSLFFDNIDLDQKELGLVKGLVSQYKNR